MNPLQAIILLYAGMLIESPDKRKSFMDFINGAGAEVEKAVRSLMNKGGEPKDEPPEQPEPTEFR